MTQKHVQWLAAIVVGLVLLIFVLNTTDDTGPSMDDTRLLPDLQARANDIARIEVTSADEDGSVTITRSGDGWVVSSRDDYPADIGKLRPLIVALAEARIVEEKTANPGFYDRLGVDDPTEGGSGTKLTVGGDGFSYAVILGDTAQRSFRYARIDGEAQSVLIDRNPDVPDTAGDWLVGEIVDLPATRVRKVTIAHADGETITIGKDTEDQTDFTVLDIPEGRELSYATVANGMGGALAGLELDDVRAAVDAQADATATFETWDGLRVVASVATDGDGTWIGFSAEAYAPPAADEGPATNEEAEADADEAAADDSETPAAAAAAEAISARVAGWQYTLPDYKKNLLVRRWTDILKAEDTDAE
jgi:hypothetical protein